ncbi:cytochrome P450 [Rhizopogon vinicolor AM-OR11-026]|uniref:Cytochrome P450 n=1 Tax=Rhizopogon vinicolor AM-OR11-026 TaxID=1314800 RepID=A0A1B7NET2_9AGAM|nr:cytochrome P450 [Rhizopogon vinicolor AM-OR11-026]
MSLVQILTIGIPCVIALVVALRQTRRRAHPLPPGPRPLPLLGNALQIDTKRPWLTYTVWEKIYGKLMYTSLLGIDMVVISSETIARELLDKRSAIYSDRPVFRTSELAGLDFSSALLPYGETLQRHRKIMHQVMRADAAISYREIYSRHANELVVNLLNTTIDPYQHVHLCMASLIVAITYGHTANMDATLTGVSELADVAKRVLTPEKAALFTAFPFLEKLPAWCLGGDYALLGHSKELSRQILNEPFDEVKGQMAEGTASKSLVADFLSQADGDTDEYMMKCIALTGYLAGTETSASAVYTFIMAMALYPDVQARARAEINKVVGHDRIPSIDDRASLPYLDAILYEVLRWCPPLPLGIAHVTSKDDIYNGYFIPKGALIVVNQWALSRDEDTYPDASRFDPNRHLTAEGQLKVRVFNHFVFGNGRRICPGRSFAENSVWTVIVTILSVLQIDHARDPDGNRIEIKPEFTHGAGIHPEPFRCSFESVNTTREGQLRAMMNLK